MARDKGFFFFFLLTHPVEAGARLTSRVYTGSYGRYNIPIVLNDKQDTSPAITASGRSAWLVWLGIFTFFAILYGATAQRGPAWQDSGIFQLRIGRFDLFGWLGLALSHPLLILGGKGLSFLPFGPLAWRINLLSSAAGAVAAANIGLMVWRLTEGKWLGSVFAALTFGLAHTPWWLGTICESQMLYAAIFTCELHLLVSFLARPSLKLAFFLGLVSGLGLMAHNLSLLGLPAYGLSVLYCCWKRKLPPAAVACMVGGYLVGSGLFLGMIVSQAQQIGYSQAIQSALFGSSWRGEVLGGSGRAVVMGIGYIGLNFPNLAGPLMVAGVWGMSRNLAKPLLAAFGYLFAIFFVFAIRYTVPDQFMFFLPLYVLISIGAGLGWVYLARHGRPKAVAWIALVLVLCSPMIYGLAPAVWTKAHLPIPGRSDLAFRDPARYWLTPWKHNEDSAGMFARAALTEVPPGSIIIADSTSLYPLVWVREVDGLGSDVKLVGIEDATVESVGLTGANVFVVSDRSGYYPPWLDGRGDIKKLSHGQVLFNVIFKPAATTKVSP